MSWAPLRYRPHQRSELHLSSYLLESPIAHAGRYPRNHFPQPLAHASGWVKQTGATLLAAFVLVSMKILSPTMFSDFGTRERAKPRGLLMAPRADSAVD